MSVTGGSPSRWRARAGCWCIAAACLVTAIIVAVILLSQAPAAMEQEGLNTGTPVPEPAPAVPPVASPAPETEPDGNLNAVNLTLLEQMVQEQVNRVRGEHGLRALVTEPALGRIARAHSRDMAAHGYFGHLNLDEWDATARGAAAGYTCFRDPGGDVSSAIAENLFAVYADEPLVQETAGGLKHYPATEAGIAAMAVDAWMFSPGHRENLLDPGAAREGIGAAYDNGGLVFVTENLC